MRRGTIIGIYQQPHAAEATLQRLRQNKFFQTSVIHRAGSHLSDTHLSEPTFSDGADGDNLRARARHFADMVFGRWIGLRPTQRAYYGDWLVEDESAVVVITDERGTGAFLTFLARRKKMRLSRLCFTRPLAVRRRRRSLPTLSRRLAPTSAPSAPAISPPRKPQTRVARQGRPLQARLLASEQRLDAVYRHLTAFTNVEGSGSLASDWLLDNRLVIQGHIEDFRRSLPRNYEQELPLLVEGDNGGLPRVYSLACVLTDSTEARIDYDILHDFLQAYQSVTALTIGELWAVPLMLRLRLIEELTTLALEVDQRQRERELAAFWANRMLNAARHDPDQLHAFVARLVREIPMPSPYLADQLADYLADEETALAPVREWLERKLDMTLTEATTEAQRVQAVQQIALGNAIGSLRQFSQLSYRELFESVSRVDAVLYNDPPGIYNCMNFASRDRYRHAVEDIARGGTHSEIEVALRAIALAEANEARYPNEAESHVGYFLLDAGRETLERELASKPKPALAARRWAIRYGTPLYLGGIAGLTLLICALAGGAVGGHSVCAAAHSDGSGGVPRKRNRRSNRQLSRHAVSAAARFTENGLRAGRSRHAQRARCRADAPAHAGKH